MASSLVPQLPLVASPPKLKNIIQWYRDCWSSRWTLEVNQTLSETYTVHKLDQVYEQKVYVPSDVHKNKILYME